MPVYLDLVILLNFLVDFLLLLGTNRLAGYPAGPLRAAAASVLGGIYGGACLLPGFRFLGNMLWRLVSLGLMGVIAFGLDRSTIRRCVLFVLLSMALGGIALGLGSGTFQALIGAAAGVAVLCGIGFRGKAEPMRYVPVVLRHGDRQVRLMALHDTGNTLRDPLTGTPVLVAGPRIGWELSGLTAEELRDPAAAVVSHPGLRLIPYHAVGKSAGLLPAVRVGKARIGNRERSVLVAFSPEGLGQTGEFEGLIGGEL